MKRFSFLSIVTLLLGVSVAMAQHAPAAPAHTPAAAAPPAAAATPSAGERTFALHPDGGSRLQFVSDAPIETITGVSSAFEGEIHFNPENLARVSGTVKAKIEGLRTGNDIRDGHLRSDHWLDAEHFPEATFTIDHIEGARRLTPNETARVKIHGQFTLHGVTKPLVAEAQIRLVPVNDTLRAAYVTSDSLHVQTSFKVKLTDFGVSVPEILRIKVSNEIEVNLTLRANAT